MNDIMLATVMTYTEEKLIGIPPLIVCGRCECGRYVAVRVYGMASTGSEIHLSGVPEAMKHDILGHVTDVIDQVMLKVLPAEIGYVCIFGHAEYGTEFISSLNEQGTVSILRRLADRIEQEGKQNGDRPLKTQ